MSTKPSLNQFSYTPTQAAIVLGKHRSTIYRMIASGELPAKQTGSGQIITRTTILRWLGEQPEAGTVEAA